jgi:hypothetical protein
MLLRTWFTLHCTLMLLMIDIARRQHDVIKFTHFKIGLCPVSADHNISLNTSTTSLNLLQFAL